jgi:sialate O-acetylesterase
LPSGTPTTTMTVAGKNTVTFQDVLVGEVWFCSGQSNMGVPLSYAHNAATEVPAANDPQMRYFHVAAGPELDPSTKFDCGKWELCTPDVAAKLSAVAYFFGKELHGSLNRPVGLLISAWGGTAIEPWTPLAAIEGDPFFKGDVDRHAQMEADYPKLLADYPAKQQVWHDAMVEWNKNGGDAYNASLKAWNAAAAAAKAAGQPEPPNKPVPPATHAPQQPPAPNGGVGGWGSLFNGTVAPVIPYAIKGVIWYQGESNAGNYGKYAKNFPALIEGWRTAWGQGDFPFLFVQLPNWIQGGSWPAMREVQSKALALPNTAMVSIIDIGDRNNIHPQDKIDVGKRLSLAARHLAYGENIVASGPVYDSMKVEGNTIRISFTQTGGGLIIGSAPWTAPGVSPLPTDKLLGFAIADDKKHWFAAEAKIDGKTVVVSSDQAPNPVAVRYAWQNSPDCNLYNQEGLAAAPFRTDDWNPAEVVFPEPATAPAPTSAPPGTAPKTNSP